MESNVDRLEVRTRGREGEKKIEREGVRGEGRRERRVKKRNSFNL
jgi:hypothetical protein